MTPAAPIIFDAMAQPTYDFGSGWQTYIRVSKQCDDHNVMYCNADFNHRKIAHGLDVVVLEIRELLRLATERDFATETLLAQAFLGDYKAIESFTELALSGDTFALRVVALLGKLLALATQVEVLVTELSELTAKLSAPQFDNAMTLTNELLHGVMDRNAPPIRALRERGETSDSVVAEEFAMS